MERGAGHDFFSLVAFATATLIFWRKSDDRMALIASFSFLFLGGIGFVNSGEVLMTAYVAWRPPVILFEAIGICCFNLVLCVFPNGRFAPSWIRWIGAASIVVSAVFVVALGNVISAPRDSGSYTLSEWVLLIARMFVVIFFSIEVAAQVYRYRRVSTYTERQQTKWVVVCHVVGLGGFLGLTQLSAAVPLVPLSVGVAILRSRLFGIDVIIRRTLIYGALTSTLAFVYFVCLFLLQYLVPCITEQTDSALIFTASASTLLIVTLSRPLRQRIQGFIDRRFYRRKFNTAKVIAAFGASVRDEVDLDPQIAKLLDVAQETMQPAHASLHMVCAAPSSAPTAPSDASLPGISPTQSGKCLPHDDPMALHFHTSPNSVELAELRFDSPALNAMRASGVAVVTPLVSQGELIGVLSLGAHLSQEDYSADDRKLLDASSAQAEPAVQVARLVCEQRDQEEQRTRNDQELQLARQIQRSLLPKGLPALTGWKLEAFFRTSPRSRRGLLRLHSARRRPARHRDWRCIRQGHAEMR